MRHGERSANENQANGKRNFQSRAIWRLSEYQDEEPAKFTAPSANSTFLSLGKLDTILSVCILLNIGIHHSA